ncbi:response regulator [Alkalicoccobacillus murimartini]|uniref:Response regulator of citrate/malate metabolism n=1 Tax=Alkalicoccobacillus murimartini TaxID=171685 RepID=A0ABT9YH06_9BACI|nr:response regulator [Alkalicoccobacillus murimartini]MDQ0207153.1 response regulator of citrate/malate metabolism [Alkalicoccobacillus murimartini]
MINVLIVEDDPMVAKFNGIYLERVSGFTLVGTANNVSEAKKIIEIEEVHLILLDIYISHENGLDMLMELREKKSEIDVIVVSSANDQASIQTALRFGAVDYLMKPFEFDRFREAMNVYAKRFQQLRTEALRQEDLDHLFLSRSRVDGSSEEELPKGITKHTFLRVLKEVIKLEGWFSTADLAEATSISRVSLRKYLRYLEENECLDLDVSYEGTGRPLQQYKVSSKGNEYMLTVLSNE